MKKIGKLSINPEKVIKNDELVNLRGGSYGGGGHWLSCKKSNGSCGTEVDSCSDEQALKDLCDYGCYGWTSYICV